MCGSAIAQSETTCIRILYIYGNDGAYANKRFTKGSCKKRKKRCANCKHILLIHVIVLQVLFSTCTTESYNIPESSLHTGSSTMGKITRCLFCPHWQASVLSLPKTKLPPVHDCQACYAVLLWNLQMLYDSQALECVIYLFIYLFVYLKKKEIWNKGKKKEKRKKKERKKKEKIEYKNRNTKYFKELGVHASIEFFMYITLP